MPSHLHPRSTATSTLFAGTLVASFVVVAVPHIWPCPRPRKAFMDGEIIIDEHGRAMRRVRRKKNSDSAAEQVEVSQTQMHASTAGKKTMEEEAALLRSLQAEAAALEAESTRRECPVPKPGGVIGRWLGFQDAKNVESEMSAKK